MLRISRKDMADKFIWLLTVLLYASFLIFYSYTWGKYVLLATAIFIALIHAFRNHGKLRLYLEPFQWFVLLLSVYCLFSALWAWVPSEALEKSLTLFEVLICFSVVYMHYRQVGDITPLLSAMKWGGYVVAVYTIFFYGGYAAITEAAAEASTRLENDFANVNAIGMAAAYACILQVYESVSNRKLSWPMLMMIPCLLVIAATQSRKAIGLLVLGLYLISLFRNIGKHHPARLILNTILTAVILFGVLYFLSTTGLFGGVFDRLQSMLSGFTGIGEADGSTLIRIQMRRIGWEQFLKTPLFGIGIGSSGQLLYNNIGRNTYLHNNYIELLACGGIIGFLIYYSMYIYLFVGLIRKRKEDRQCVDICLILMILFLIMDFGAVSYSSKTQYYYFMILFIEAAVLNKSEGGRRRHGKQAPSRTPLSDG